MPRTRQPGIFVRRPIVDWLDNPKTGHAETLESLAAALRKSLSGDECRRLAELLAKEQGEGNG